MAAVSGAATSDNMSLTRNSSFGATGVQLVGGWYKPTTLTATRNYWGAGTTTIGARVGGTTSEMTYGLANATTSQVWTTSGAGIAINLWHFLMWVISINNTTPSFAARCWVAVEGAGPPKEISVTNTTAGVGSASGNTAFSFCNRGASGTAAIQGQIGWAIATTSLNGLIAHSALGTLSQADADCIYMQHVHPLWAGNWRFDPRPTQNSDIIEITHLDCTRDAILRRYVSSSGNTNLVTTATKSGVTFTNDQPPSRLREDWYLNPAGLLLPSRR